MLAITYRDDPVIVFRILATQPDPTLANFVLTCEYAPGEVFSTTICALTLDATLVPTLKRELTQWLVAASEDLKGPRGTLSMRIDTVVDRVAHKMGPNQREPFPASKRQALRDSLGHVSAIMETLLTAIAALQIIEDNPASLRIRMSLRDAEHDLAALLRDLANLPRGKVVRWCASIIARLDHAERHLAPLDIVDTGNVHAAVDELWQTLVANNYETTLGTDYRLVATLVGAE